MPMSNDLPKFWDQTVSKGHRHFTDHMGIEKRSMLATKFHDHVLDQLNVDDIKLTLDWGCGGGLLSRIVAKFSDLILLDISPQSLQTAKKHVSDLRIPKTILFKDPTDDLTFLTEQNIDLLICYNLIYHFPNYAYWQKIADIWNTIKPTFIALQTKIADKTYSAKNYYTDGGFLNGLIMTKDDFLKPFLDTYDIQYYCEKKHHDVDKRLGFVILRSHS